MSVEELMAGLDLGTFGVEDPLALRSYWREVMVTGQKSLLGFMVPQINACRVLARELAGALSRRLVTIDVRALLLERAMMHSLGGGRQEEGLPVLARRLWQECRADPNQKIFVLLEGVDVFQQASPMLVHSALRASVNAIAETSGSGETEDADRMFIAVVAHDEADISEGLRKCTEFFRLRMLTNEEKVMGVQRWVRANRGLAVDISPEALAICERAFGFQGAADYCQRMGEALLRCAQVVRPEPRSTAAVRISPDCVSKYWPMTDAEGDGGDCDLNDGVLAVGICSGLGVLQRYQAKMVPGSGQIVMCCRSSEHIMRAIRIATAVNMAGGHLDTRSDIYFDVDGDRYDIQGGSSALAVALALLAALHKTGVRLLCATGGLDLSGMIRPVGHLADKIITAYNHGVSRMLIPRSQCSLLDRLPSYVPARMNIVPVATLSEAWASICEPHA
jgi:hypothetical protein